MLLGALQICIGCLISSVPIIGIFSVNLIQKGFTNITKGIEMMMNGKDFKNLREFFDFQKAIFFQRHLFEQITLERDEKKTYQQFYMNNLKKNDFLRKKIEINRENAFKNLIESKLQEIDLNLEEENEKIENLEKKYGKY